MSDKHMCPNCMVEEMRVFNRVSSVPTNSCILLNSPEEARAYPRGEIALGFCPECGFISNLAFDRVLTEYSGRYEETQGFSPTFSSFHRELARRLIDRYNLRGKKVIEIGCGKGEFLHLLAELGDNNGLGFDPGYQDGRLAAPVAGSVEFIQDFYSEKYASHKADFLCCKMTLEHIDATRKFVSMVRSAVGEKLDTLVFFQVPDVTRILEDCAFEDIYYEHCSYFSPGSLARLFRDCGFRVETLDKEYDDQYLTIVAMPDEKSLINTATSYEQDRSRLQRLVADFPQRLDMKLAEFRNAFTAWRGAGRKVVLWGSGSKGVSFLTTLGLSDEVEYVVDINPNRQGHFMAGGGQEIVSPEFLKDYKPDNVIIMNRIYRDEIETQLSGMDLCPAVIAI